MIQHIKNSTKHILTVLLVTFCLCMTCFNLLATETSTTTRVFDNADLFSTEEITQLETSIADISATYHTDIAIVTTNDMDGKSNQDFADDFYDTHHFGYATTEDGLLLLINMENREVYISTAGTMIQYFTDTRISNMLAAIKLYLGDSKYYQGAERFLKETENYLIEGIPSNQHTVEGEFEYRPEPTKHKPFTNKYGDPLTTKNVLFSIPLALIIALIISLIVRAFIAYRYKHPRFTKPEAIPDSGSVHYTEKQDHFLHSHTSRVRIQSSNGSGGGGGSSSTHTSSGGSSHGGGGTSF